MKTNSLKQQRLNAELGLIIDDMGKAMWNANKEYIATANISVVGLTLHMREALSKFKEFCENHTNEKA